MNKRNLLKNAILPIALSVAALLPATDVLAASSLQDRIKTYVEAYGRYLDTMYVNGTSTGWSGTVQVGKVDELYNNMSFKHGYEVSRLIAGGVLDECCWRPSATRYPTLISATSNEVISHATVPNPAGGTFTIPTNMGLTLKDLMAEMLIVKDARPRIIDPNNQLVALEYDLIKSLIDGYQVDGNSVLGNLVWTYSYANLDWSGYPGGGPNPSFKDYYSFACVVCMNAGYYDLAGLYQNKPGTVFETYYDAIVTPKNFPASYSWLKNAIALEYTGPFSQRPPLQLSMGPTIQGKPINDVGNLSDDTIYPVHCHQAEETYFSVDPLQYAIRTNNPINGFPGSSLDTSSYYIGYFNKDSKVVTWSDDMSSQFPQNYMDVADANVTYNRPHSYHSMHTGQLTQFTAWSRLTHPEEGTFFPLNGGGQPLPVQGCSEQGAQPTGYNW